ncbi:MAG: hypothetical protein MIO93_10845 [ANME-2 cluster archaeon]|jgi:hypothetical protein|nr:hypothetical protein [ANME-2 cluster archaeon]
MGNPNCKIRLIYAPHSLPAYDHDGLIFKMREIRFSSAIPVLFNNLLFRDEARKATRMPAPPTQVRNLIGRRLAEVNLKQLAGLISYQDREVGRL